MKDVKEIEIVLENCEVLKLTPEDVGVFSLNNVKTNYRKSGGYISEYATAESVYIELLAEANEQKLFLETETKPFDRLQAHHDITQVYLTFEDGERKQFFVPWKGDSDYTNEIQSSSLHEQTKSLFITVSDKETANDFMNNVVKYRYG